MLASQCKYIMKKWAVIFIVEAVVAFALGFIDGVTAAD